MPVASSTGTTNEPFTKSTFQANSTLEDLRDAIRNGAHLNLLLLLLGKDNIEQKQESLKKQEDQLRAVQDYIKRINTESTRLQSWITAHSKDDTFKKMTYGVEFQSTLSLMEKHGGYSMKQLVEMNTGKGQAQNLSNALINTAKALDKDAQNLTTKATSSTQDYNAYLDLISSTLKSYFDAIKRTIGSF